LNPVSGYCYFEATSVKKTYTITEAAK